MRRATREALGGYLYLVPNFFGFLLFVSFPVIFSFILAFCDWSLLTRPRFVGLGNFARLIWFRRVADSGEAYPLLIGFFVLVGLLIAAILLVIKFWNRTETAWRFAYRFGFLAAIVALFVALRYLGEETFAKAWQANDPDFWYFFYNTIYLMGGIPVGIAMSLALALVMNQKLRGIVFFRTIFFLPNFTAGVAVLMLWKWLYQTDFGLINGIIEGAFSLVGLQVKGPNWLGDPFWAKPALIIMGLWSGVGGMNMILYLAGLQNINPELYEAAEIDGAGRWDKFRHITWPMLSPTTFFIVVMSTIGGFQGGFMAAFIMTAGGPANSTTTLSYYIYNNAFTFFRMGYAATIAWFLFLCVFAATLINWRYGGKLVHYR